MFDPFSTAGSGGDSYGDLSPSQTYGPPPSAPGAGDGFDWTSFGQQIPKLLGATAGLVSSIKGQPYTAGPYGVSGGGLYPQGGYFGGGSLGGGVGISTTTLMLIGGAILLFVLARK